MKIKVTTTFLLVSAIMLLTGQAYIFGVYIVSVLIHELAHYFVSRKRGFTNSRIVISAFGAVLYGNYELLDNNDELAIALAGPVCSISIFIILTALFWIYPESYNWTSYAATANLAVGIINLLPCYPLDGGRILVSLINKNSNHNKAVEITLLVGRIVSVLIFVVFAISLFITPNFSLGLFAVFLFASNLRALDDNVYKKLINYNIEAKLIKGMNGKYLCVSSDTTLLEIFRKLNNNNYYFIMLIDKGKIIQCLTQHHFNELLINNSYQVTLSQALKLNTDG